MAAQLHQHAISLPNDDGAGQGTGAHVRHQVNGEEIEASRSG